MGTVFKEVLRARFFSCINDWEDPTGSQVLRNLINNWLSIINVYSHFTGVSCHIQRLDLCKLA